MSDDFVAVATWSRRKRHWALAATMEPYQLESVGRVGKVLCSLNRGTDQEATDNEADMWPHYPGLRVVVADLSPCKGCEKSRNARIRRAP